MVLLAESSTLPPASLLDVGPGLREGSVPPQHFSVHVMQQLTVLLAEVSLPVSLVQPEVKVSISRFMSYVHMSVKEMSKTYLAMERRYNYTTPKTFLEQIKLYQNLLSIKRSELTTKIERLEKGLTKLRSTTLQVPAHGRG